MQTAFWCGPGRTDSGLSGGLTTAIFFFRICVCGKPYLLRIMMNATGARVPGGGDPTHQFSCLKLAAEAGICSPDLTVLIRNGLFANHRSRFRHQLRCGSTSRNPRERLKAGWRPKRGFQRSGLKSLLRGGAAARGLPAWLAGGRRAAAWGEPACPGWPRRGNGKGGSNSLRRRLIRGAQGYCRVESRDDGRSRGSLGDRQRVKQTSKNKSQ